MTEQDKKTTTGMLGNALNRTSGNFTPEEAYEPEQEKAVTSNDAKEKTTTPNTEETKQQEKNESSKQIKSNERKNQQAQFKISQSLKDELLGIKALTNSKYDYEVIQLLIDSYKKTLSTEDIKKLRLIIELNLG